MTNRDLGYISIRILSIYFCVKSISDITMYLSNRMSLPKIESAYSHISKLTMAITISAMSLYLIVGIILWIKTDRFTHYIIPQNSDDEKMDKELNRNFLLDIQAVAFSIVGLIIAMNSIVYIYQCIGATSITLGIDSEQSMLKNIIYAFKMNLGGRLFTLVLGLILFLKPRKIVKMIKTL